MAFLDHFKVTDIITFLNHVNLIILLYYSCMYCIVICHIYYMCGSAEKIKNKFSFLQALGQAWAWVVHALRGLWPAQAQPHILRWSYGKVGCNSGGTGPEPSAHCMQVSLRLSLDETQQPTCQTQTQNSILSRPGN